MKERNPGFPMALEMRAYPITRAGNNNPKIPSIPSEPIPPMVLGAGWPDNA